MKKQELKHDPIRDYIISFYNYLSENKNTTLSVSLTFVFVLMASLVT